LTQCAVLIDYGQPNYREHLPSLQNLTHSFKAASPLAVIKPQARLSGKPCGCWSASEKEREEAFQQLKAKLERGASQAERGELLDGDEVFDELRQLIEERRPARRKDLKP